MKTRRGNDRRPWREKTVGALTAGCFLLYLIALSPHLVHHLFEKDHDPPTCPFLALSQHTPELQPDPPALTRLIVTGILDDHKPTVSLPAPPVLDSHPRAPPRTVPPT
jgi:hypothetical protein